MFVVNFNEHGARTRKKRKHVYEFQKFSEFAYNYRKSCRDVCVCVIFIFPASYDFTRVFTNNVVDVVCVSHKFSTVVE